MDYISYQQKLEQVKQLIRQKATGNYKSFSQKLGVCYKTMYSMLENLKIQGYSIKYDKQRCTYYFDDKDFKK